MGRLRLAETLIGAGNPVRKPPRLEEREDARRAAHERTRARIAQIHAKSLAAKTLEAATAPALSSSTTAIPNSPTHVAAADRSDESRPKATARVQSGAAGLTFSDRLAPGISVAPQPWVHRLTDAALRVAAESSVLLALVWPLRFDSIVPIHAFASLERTMATDLPGLRTLLYPGHHSTRSALNAWLINRRNLSDLYRALWTPSEAGTQPVAVQESKPMRALLAGLNTIQVHTPTLVHPALGELIPTFMFDPQGQTWRAVVEHPLERTLRKIPNPQYRSDLRAAIGKTWLEIPAAPGALFIVHNSATKSQWKSALQQIARANVAPELFLFDATSAADQRNSRSVKRIPECLKSVREGEHSKSGALIVTDDPRIFFTLRARLAEQNIPFEVEVLVAEADQPLLASDPLPRTWAAAQKSNALINVAVMDRDACSVATTFARLAPEVSGNPSSAHEALLEACRYLLRLSNLPAGYRDLTAATAEGELDEHSSNRYAWATIEQAIRVSLAAGGYGSKIQEVEKAIIKGRALVDDWSDATPMALKLKATVSKFALESHDGLVAVLPNQRYVKLAHRFLARSLSESWTKAEPRVEWHTLATIAKNLATSRDRRHFVFLGLNRSVLRILLAHPDLPHGTSLFLSYRHAQSALVTLTGMKALDELKAYRGRIGLLLQELDRRLKEVPSIHSIDRLGDLSLTFNFEERGATELQVEQSYHRFDLDGGHRAYRSGWVYKYEPDEDPIFKRTAVGQIQAGDFIFDMSERLRGQVEAALQVNQDGTNSTIYPERVFLRLFHQDVQRRTAALFAPTKRAALAREIHRKMMELDATAMECREERVIYWLDLEGNENVPHASKDPKFFKLFCRALEFTDDEALRAWNFVKNARRFNQNLGRMLAAQYAEIIFQPESATIYRHIAPDLVRQLQQEALQCVFRVEHVEPPAIKSKE